MSTVNKHAQGIILRPQDYAGLGARLLIMLIDFAVVLLALLGCGFVALLVSLLSGLDGEKALSVAVLVIPVWAFWAALYFTALEGSSVGTLGLRLTGTMIVTLEGEPPSFGMMIIRLICWTLGPVHPLYDLFFMTGDECKQMLRDKITATYVVRRDAVVVGKADIRPARLFVLGLNFPYWEVKRKKPAQAMSLARG